MRALGRAIALLAGSVAMSSLGLCVFALGVLSIRCRSVHAAGGPKFDLNALTANKVNYFISDQGPSTLMPGDSVTAI